jgi:LemA protein
MNNIWLIMLGVLGAALLWGVGTYNRLIRLRNLVKEGWSGIEAQLNRRSDLIPNIVETVKGYAAHEKLAFESVTQARAQATASHAPSERASAENQVAALLGRIVAVAEAYPDLKANASFLGLQRELSNVEEQLNLARRYYNGAVRNFNTAIESVPSNVIAGVAGMVAADYFGVEDPADRAAPRVSFGK